MLTLQELLDKEHSKANTVFMQQMIGPDESLFIELFELFINGNKQTQQRAAWVVRECFQKHAFLITPVLPRLIEKLKQNNLHDGVIRNILAILAEIKDLSERLTEPLLDYCFDKVQAQDVTIAIKVFAIENIYNATQQYPELKTELRIIIEDLLPYASAGFKSRGGKILKKLGRDNN